jgi:hypothetical protein
MQDKILFFLLLSTLATFIQATPNPRAPYSRSPAYTPNAPDPHVKRADALKHLERKKKLKRAGGRCTPRSRVSGAASAPASGSIDASPSASASAPGFASGILASGTVSSAWIQASTTSNGIQTSAANLVAVDSSFLSSSSTSSVLSSSFSSSLSITPSSISPSPSSSSSPTPSPASSTEAEAAELWGHGGWRGGHAHDADSGDSQDEQDAQVRIPEC